MSRNSGQTSSLQSARSRFRLVLYLGLPAVASVTLLAIILKQLYTAPDSALMSEGLDAIVFETVIILGGALMGALGVGLIFEAYQARYADQSVELAAEVAREGLVRVYKNANDPRLLAALESAIARAYDEVLAVGLGLGILYNNRGLLAAIAARVNATTNFRVTVLTGARSNPGVMTRIQEEEAWHAAQGVNYDPAWVDHYPAEIRSVITVLTEQPKRNRIKVTDANGMPMLGLIKIDDRYFWFSYGSPDIRGSESPWVELVDDAASRGNLLQFLHRTTDYFRSTAP
jgi:hypothetical protein